MKFFRTIFAVLGRMLVSSVFGAIVGILVAAGRFSIVDALMGNNAEELALGGAIIGSFVGAALALLYSPPALRPAIEATVDAIVGSLAS